MPYVWRMYFTGGSSKVQVVLKALSFDWCQPYPSDVLYVGYMFYISAIFMPDDEYKFHVGIVLINLVKVWSHNMKVLHQH